MRESRTSDSKIYLDSSFIISLLVPGHIFHAHALKIAKACEKNASFLYSLLSVDETIYSVKTDYKISFDLIEKAITQFLSAENAEMLTYVPTYETLIELFKIIEKYKLKPRDACHYLMMRQNAIGKMATFDTDFVSKAKELKIEVLK